MAIFADSAPTPIALQAARVSLTGELTIPASPSGVIVLASSDPRAASVLTHAGFSTLQVDLLSGTCRSGQRLALQRDIPALAERLEGALAWLSSRPDLRDLPIGLFGADTASAAALVVAARSPDVRAIVSLSGRPDLAHDVLREVRCPSLWILGRADTELLDLHHRALRRIGANARLGIVPGGRDLDGASDDALRLAASWFRDHLARTMHDRNSWRDSRTDAKQGSSSRER